MKKIDLLKKKQCVEKHPGLYFMIQPYNLPRTISVLIALSFFPLFKNVFQCAFSTLYSINQLLLLKKRFAYYQESGYSITYNVLNRELVKTSEYQECSNLYDTYIKNIASFLHIFNFSSTKDLLIFMEHLLTMGIFSSNFEHKYHQYKTYYEYTNDLLGATTLTGSCVCRHMASFFNDIVNAYGETSSFLVVGTSRKDSISELLDCQEHKYEHAVIGVKSSEEKYIFDPTEGLFAARTGETDNEKINATIATAITSGKNNYYYEAPKQLELKPEYHDKTIEIANLPFANISKDEIEYYYNEATSKFLNNTSLANDFYLENISLVTHISELIEEVCPISDEQITSWCLTKSPEKKKS